VQFEGPAATRIVVRRFFFPGWRVRRDDGQDVPVASGPQHLVAWPAGPGAASFELDRVPLREERLGLAICALGWVLLLLWRLVAYRRRRTLPQDIALLSR
jgi:hypothetical protein